ncbi:MAG: signal recognition particle-docking protein FtsY [Alphaproteobacteria bacterium]|nr:signal recognition particle-docking protein FtsY [Alphaproteobacteria bacterium]
MSWFRRLKEGLGKSSSRLVDGIARALGSGRLDDATVQEIEDALIAADLGPAVAAKLAGGLRQKKFDKGVSGEAVRESLAEDVAALLQPVARGFAPDPAKKPHIVLVVGVNGSGKTTTIGKLAHRLKAASGGTKILMVAGDTFRAAAVSQLKIWGERTGSTVIAGAEGADAAGLAFDGVTRGRSEGADLVLIDTAGRLHNKADLMAELAKIVRVIGRIDAAAPHDVLLVLDATTGQNALAQVETFKQMVNVTGLVLTKLDGSARGGVLVAIAERFKLPVVAVGVGESADDLQPFEARGFARGLLGLET